MTGAELARRLRLRAASLGISVNTFCAPLGGTGFVSQLQRAAAPKPHTVARIEAFLAGSPLPPRRGYQRLHENGRAFDYSRPADPPPPVDRDPCFQCGTRADIGCKHRRAE